MLELGGVSLVLVNREGTRGCLETLAHFQDRVRFRDVFLVTGSAVAAPEHVITLPSFALKTDQDRSSFLLTGLPQIRGLFAERILLVEPGNVLVDAHRWDQAFERYDYIGAPWGDQITGRGIPGIRSQRLLAALGQLRERITQAHPEDVLISTRYRRALEAEGVRFAPPVIAARFAAAGSWDNDVFCAAKRVGNDVSWTFSETTPLPPLRPPDILQPGEARLNRLFNEAFISPSDINEHTETLARLASVCERVTEFGTRRGVSTRALLYGRPRSLVSYDLAFYPDIEPLERAAEAAGIAFRFVVGDVRTIKIDETDLLFIDTMHVYEQLREELFVHGNKAQRFLAMHDTTTFASHGETPGSRGLWPAIEEFLGANSHWRLMQRYENNHGLTILIRH